MNQHITLSLSPSHYGPELARHARFADTMRRVGQRGLEGAISSSAGALAAEHTRETGLRSAEGDVYNVIAHLKEFADASITLDRLRNNPHTTRQDRERQLERIIPFNHAVRELIDGSPQLTLGELNHFLTSMYVSSRAQTWKSADERTITTKWFDNEVKSVLVGMSHEIATEQIIGMIPSDVEIDYAKADGEKYNPVEQEMNGVDLDLIYHGRELPIDVKASQRSATEKRRNGGPAIWSGCREEDFFVNGARRFRITPQVAADKVRIVLAELEEADRVHQYNLSQPAHRLRAV